MSDRHTLEQLSKDECQALTDAARVGGIRVQVPGYDELRAVHTVMTWPRFSVVHGRKTLTDVSAECLREAGLQAVRRLAELDVEWITGNEEHLFEMVSTYKVTPPQLGDVREVRGKPYRVAQSNYDGEDFAAAWITLRLERIEDATVEEET